MKNTTIITKITITFVTLLGLFSCSGEWFDLNNCDTAVIFFEINHINADILEVSAYTDGNHDKCDSKIRESKVMFFKGNDTLKRHTHHVSEGRTIRFEKEFSESVDIPSEATFAQWIIGGDVVKPLEIKREQDDDPDPDDPEITKLDSFYQFREKTTGDWVNLFVRIPDLVKTSDGILTNTSDSKFIFKSEDEWSLALIRIIQYDLNGERIKTHSQAGFLVCPTDTTEIQVSGVVRVLLPETASLRIVLKDQEGKEYYCTIP